MIVDDFFKQASELNVMVIGDVMVDRYLEGVVNRISPEAPVPILEQVKTEDRLGGAANVALNIQAIGANPILCGLIGNDADSNSFFSLLAEKGLSDLGILASTERCTTVKTRFIADHQHLLRLDKEDARVLSEKEADEFCSLLETRFDQEKVDVVILQDYNKGVLSPEVIDWVLKVAKKKDIPVAVDPKFHNFWSFKGVDLLKPNLKEVQDVLKRAITPEIASLKNAAAELRNKLNHHRTLITLSAQGIFIENGVHSSLVPARSRKVADVCGAGDAVISIAAVGLALGLEMREIALLSNLVGGQVVERPGVVPIDKTQLKEELLNEILAQ